MTTERPPSLFNVWWVLAVLSALGTIVAATLEYLGILHDLGDYATVVGLLLTVFFGATASTRSAVREIRYSLRGITDEITTMRVVLERMLAILDARLPREGPP